MLFRNMLNKYYAEAGSDGAEGGGSGGGVQITPEIQALIDAQVSGLKAKNGEILGKLKEQSESLKRYEGIDPDAVRNIMKRFADDEEAKLIAEGKIDDVLNKRTERMRSETEKQIEKAALTAKSEKERADKFADRVFEAHLRAVSTEAGIHPQAVEDALFRAKTMFELDENGDPIAKEGNYGKDGKPNTLKDWFSDMQEKAPHWWPASQGGGSPPGGGGGSVPKSLSECKTEAERIAYLKRNS